MAPYVDVAPAGISRSAAQTRSSNGAPRRSSAMCAASALEPSKYAASHSLVILRMGVSASTSWSA